MNTPSTIPLPIRPVSTVVDEAPIPEPPTPNLTAMTLHEPVIQPDPPSAMPTNPNTPPTPPTIQPIPQPNDTNTHPMVTREKAGISKTLERMNCHVINVSPLPRSHVHALRDSSWK